jgi:sulfatase modifying factor 1
MKKARVLAIMVCMMAAVNFASADTIRGIDIDFVTIGHAGNAADTQVMWTDGTTGYGAVGYNYRIGKYEVTNAQWDAFTAAAGAPTGNDGGYSYSAGFTGAQQPTTGVSWYEAAQFCNYLTSGNKSQGVYQFSGNNTNPGNFLGINRDAAISSYGIAYVIPTEDEWYKAAYFKPNGSGYSLYANGTNIAPIAGVQSNWNNAIGAPWNINNGTPEQNGTFDMMGNVWEWNETLIGSGRALRGGSYDTYGSDYFLASSYRNYYYPSDENYVFGFRVASVPEPCSIALLSLCGLALLKKRRA